MEAALSRAVPNTDGRVMMEFAMDRIIRSLVSDQRCAYVFDLPLNLTPISAFHLYFITSYASKNWTFLNQQLDNGRMNDFMVISVHLVISRYSFPVVDIID
jgi:hypothetical protein